MAAKTKRDDVRILILQRGWVMVGRYSKKGEEVRLDGARVVRRWGTTKGLGEIAEAGPLPNTVLDPAGVVTAHELVVVAAIQCRSEAWAAHIKD